MLISAAQQQRYQAYYAHRPVVAQEKPHRWASTLQPLLTVLQPASVLDYGCGLGRLRTSLTLPPDLHWTDYDPGVMGKDTPPAPAALVVCCDVLEHVEPECLAAVVQDLLRLATQALFVAIACKPSGKTFPDGTNHHQRIAAPSWWHGTLCLFAPFVPLDSERPQYYVGLWRHP
jgi:hypothetical protein